MFFSYKDKSTLSSMIIKGRDGSDKNRMHDFQKKDDTMKVGLDNLFKCVRYCLNEVDCRRTMLLEYFGEKFASEKCGKTCDNCKQRFVFSAS